LLFVTKIVDACTDPLMGAVADRTRSRWGKIRPWLLLAALEPPADESDTITLDAERPADFVIIEAVAAAARFLQRTSIEPPESHFATSDITPC
jgi:GPH family glycoside/pentoside/hexuronide:cation symporter